MRLIHRIAAAIAVALLAGPVFGQTLLDRFETQAKSPAAGAASGGATGAATGAPDDPVVASEGVFLGLEPDEADKSGRGTRVVSVRKDGPAEKGGLMPGDLITAINGKPCRKFEDLDDVLAASTAGSKLTMTILRKGKTETKVVTLEGKQKPVPAATDPLPAPPKPAAPTPAPLILSPATDPAATAPALPLPPPPDGDKPAIESRPATPLDPFAPPASDPPASEPPAGVATGKASLGIKVVPLNDDTRVQYDVRSIARQGALIVSVSPGSPADTAGLPIGGVVVAIDGLLVKSSDDLVEVISALSPGRDVELRYAQGDQVFTKTVRLAPAAARATVPATRPGLTLSNDADAADGPQTRRLQDLVGSGAAGSARPSGPLTARPAVGSGVPNASTIVELLDEISLLKTQIEKLEDRVKQLERKDAAPPPPLPGNP